MTIYEVLERAVVGKHVRIVGGDLDGVEVIVIPCQRKTAPNVKIEFADGSTKMFWADRLKLVGV